MQTPSFTQKQANRHAFYQNGLYLPTRTIVLGTNPMRGADDGSELTDTDFIDFVKNLHILEEERGKNESDNLIKVLLNSAGGDPYLGFAFYDAIKGCKSPVEIRCIGEVMSMGTILLQAADYRNSYPNTSFMIHKGTVDFGSMNVDDAEIQAEETARVVEKMLDVYESTMAISRAKIEELMGKDTYMNAQKAKIVGLIDGIKETFPL